MEDTEIKDMWKAYDKMIEESRILNLQSWALNLRCFDVLQAQKAKSKLRSLIIPKIVVVTLGIGWVWFLGIMLSYLYSQIIIAISLIILMALTVVCTIIYIQNIAVIAQVNYTDSVAEAQKKIAFLQSSIVNSIRVGWLQLPFYSTCFITNKLLASGSVEFWVIQTLVTLFLAWLAVYLFRNISLKKRSKKWVKQSLKGYGLSRVANAMDFIEEIEQFKKDVVINSKSDCS